MNKMDSLGDRMKRYEAASKSLLIKRTPVIIRIDGCHFHTFTKSFDKPFDSVLMESMKQTARYLCENIQGCVLGYTQSDEITLVLTDYRNINSQGWFDYQVQKLCSVSASMATMAFNKFFNINTHRYDTECMTEAHVKAIEKGATFDARCFNIPFSEVANCLLWRQQDATRNSIQGLAQSLFPNREIQGLNTSQLQDLMMNNMCVNWNDLPTDRKRGSCIVKNEDGKWIVDDEIPIFTGTGRDYIESRVNFNHEM